MEKRTYFCVAMKLSFLISYVCDLTSHLPDVSFHFFFESLQCQFCSSLLVGPFDSRINLSLLMKTIKVNLKKCRLFLLP